MEKAFIPGSQDASSLFGFIFQYFLAHHDPSYLASDVSRSRGAPYATLNRRAGEFDVMEIDPQLDYYVNMPDHLVLAKSLVSFHLSKRMSGMQSIRLRLRTCPPPGDRPESSSSVGLELGGPWSFYNEFYAAHGLTAALSFVKPQTARAVVILYGSLYCCITIREKPRSCPSCFTAGWLDLDIEREHLSLESHSSHPAQLFSMHQLPKQGGAAGIAMDSSGELEANRRGSLCLSIRNITGSRVTSPHTRRRRSYAAVRSVAWKTRCI